MIDFLFYSRMRTHLAKGVFNQADYTEQDLQILFNSLPIIYSEYCNEEFRRGALEYLEENKAKYPFANVLRTRDFHKPLPLKSSEGVTGITRELIATLKTILGDDDISHISNITDRVAQYVEKNASHVHSAFQLGDYYSKWLCTQEDYDHESWLKITFVAAYFTDEEKQTDFLFQRLGGGKNLSQILKTNFQVGEWDIKEPLGKFFLLQDLEKDFYQNLIAANGLPAFALMLKIFADPTTTKDYFYQLGSYNEEYNGDDYTGATGEREVNWKAIKEYTVFDEAFIDDQEYRGDDYIGATEGRKPTIFHQIFEDLSKLVEINPAYSDVDFKLAESVGFDIVNFKKLAYKYEMPAILARRIMDEEMPNFRLGEDNVSNTLSPIFTEFFGTSRGYTLRLPKSKHKALHVELMPKTDPTALFMGRMTSCCQFYTGNSSDQAVIPFYTDPNIGLLAIKEGNQVVAGSLVWLCNDNGRQGMVLESFVFKAENYHKAYLPFVTQLAEMLQPHGINLYMGNGGKSPSLKVGDEVVEFLPEQTPLTEGYKPYGDSKNVYLIQPGVEYTPVFRESPEERADKVIKLFAEFPENILEKLMKLPLLRKAILYGGEDLATINTILSQINEDSLDLLISIYERDLFPEYILLSDIKKTLDAAYDFGIEKIQILITSVPDLLKYVLTLNISPSTLELFSILTSEDIEKLMIWEKTPGFNYYNIDVTRLVKTLRMLSCDAVAKIVTEPMLSRMVALNIIILPCHMEEISETILSLSEEDIQKLATMDILAFPDNKVNLYTLKNFLTISRAICPENLINLMQLKFIEFKAVFTLPIDIEFTSDSGIITINKAGIGLEDIEIIRRLLPEDIAKLQLFNSCEAWKLKNTDIRALISFVSKFSYDTVELLVKLPDILSHLTDDPAHLMSLAELCRHHGDKLNFFSPMILYSSEQFKLISLFLNNCDAGQLESLEGLGVLEYIRHADDLPKCLEFLSKSNEDKLQVILEDDVDFLFNFRSNSIKTYCTEGVSAGYSADQIINFVSHIKNHPLSMLQFKRAEEITGRNLHKIIPLAEYINHGGSNDTNSKIYGLINDKTFDWGFLPNIDPARIVQDLDYYIRIAQSEAAGPIGEDESVTQILEEGEAIDYLGAIARLYFLEDS